MDPMAADLQGADDGELVLAVLRGQLSAFDELVRRHQRQATGVAYRLLSNRDDAMEVVQDAFLQAFEKLGTLSKPGRFRSWLLRIVSNLALNRRRSRALRRMSPLELNVECQQDRSEINRPDPKALAPDRAALACEMEQIIEQTIDQLPETQRSALLLFVRTEMPQKEIAGLLGCSVEAVKWHVFTARKKLKEKLKDYF